MRRVRISEFKSHLSELLRGVEAGQVIEITDRARPIARVVPVPTDIDEVEVIPAQRPFAAVRRRRYPPAKLAVTSLEALREERGSR